MRQAGLLDTAADQPPQAGFGTFSTGSGPYSDQVTGLTEHVAPSCTGTGSDGNRVQAMYVRETDQADRYAEVLPVILNELQSVDDVFAASAKRTGGGKRVRWVHAQCSPSVLNVVVPNGALTTTFHASATALRNLGYNRADRKYLTFSDSTTGLGSPLTCGLAEFYADSTPTADNYNNGAASTIARINTQCWVRGTHSTAAHELAHSLGAVQPTAPNGSDYGHCDDEADLMCYYDGTIRDGAAMAMRDVCPADEEDLLDCGKDDYFHTDPPAGNYLSEHWNVADSSFLDTVTALSDPPALDLTASAAAAETGDTVTYTATTDPGAGLTWEVSRPTCVEHTSTTTLTINCPYNNAGDLLVRATAAQSGLRSTAAKILTITRTAPLDAWVFSEDADLFATQPYTEEVAIEGGKAPFTYTWTSDNTACTVQGDSNGVRFTRTCPVSSIGETSGSEVIVISADQQQITVTEEKIVLAPPPTVSLNAPASIVAGTTGFMTATVSNGGTSPTYAWSSERDWLTGSTATTSAHVEPPVGATGTDTVTFTVTAADGRSASRSATYTVAPGLGLSVTSADTVVPGTSIQLTATPSKGATVTWDKSHPCSLSGTSGTTVTLTCPSSADPGEMWVSATATNGYETATVYRFITVYDPVPAPNISISMASSGVLGQATHATVSNTGGPIQSYSWSTSRPDCIAAGAGASTATIQCPLHENTGDVKVSLSVVAPDGDSATAYATITMTTRPVRIEIGSSTGSTPVASGTPVRVVGRVVDALSGVGSRAAMTLEASEIGGQGWAKIDVRTESSGEYAWSWTARTTTLLRLSVAGAGVSSAYLLVVGSTTPPPSTPTSPPPAPGKQASVVTIKPKDKNPTKFIGVAKATNGAAIRSATMALQVKWKGAKKFTTLKRATTSHSGKVVITYKVKKSGTFRYRFAGQVGYKPDMSPTVKVKGSGS
jgi:hypothetical protein